MSFQLLHCPCPAECCTSSFHQAYYWGHENCGRKMEINEHAFMRCSVHRVASFILEWRFRCNNHENAWYGPDATMLSFAVKVLNRIQVNSENEAWTHTLSETIASLVHQMLFKNLMF